MWKVKETKYVDSWDLEQEIRKLYAQKLGVAEDDLLVEWKYDGGYGCGCCSGERTFDGVKITVYEQVVQGKKTSTTKKGTTDGNKTKKDRGVAAKSERADGGRGKGKSRSGAAGRSKGR